jgi:hypothetical protein
MLAFVSNEDHTQLDVLFLNVGHGHELSDGTTLAHHKPLVLTRAGACTGDCPRRDGAIASHLFNDKTGGVAKDALESALSGGGGWQVAGSDITLQKGSSTDPDLPALEFTTGVRDGIIPTTSAEREDYTWLANLHSICSTCGLNENVLDTVPPSGLVAARFRLRNGRVHTYSVARIGSNVTPVNFKRADGDGSASSYSQAIATWMAADIEVEGDSIELVETKYDNSTGRTMTLTPDSNGNAEIAVLNLPQIVPVAPTETAGIGRHFERYYDITANPPSASSRLVPQPGAAPGAPSYDEVTWSSVHPTTTMFSDLLSALRLNPGRSAYDVLLCPPASPNFP